MNLRDKKVEKAKSLAPSLLAYLELTPEQMEKIFPLMSKEAITILNVLIMAKFGGDYYEISRELNLHFNTVKLYLKGLEEGGVRMLTEEYNPSQKGRPRVFKKVEI